MILLPDFSKSFEYENNFYLSCDSSRISKLLVHYELYKQTKDLAGEIVECGVFKGMSLIRFATFQELFSAPFSKKIIGFDTFDKCPDTEFEDDKAHLKKWFKEAGNECISKEQLLKVFKHKKINQRIELIEGNILKTVPDYLKKNPYLKISLLNLDVDIYEPSVVILEHLYPRIVKGGILILDDYGVFAGETKAIDDYFIDKDIEIKKFPFCSTPCFIIKK